MIGTYAMSVRDERSGVPNIKHYRIQKTKDGSSLFYISPQKKFPTLQDIVEFYKGKNTVFDVTFYHSKWSNDSYSAHNRPYSVAVSV